MSSLTFLLKNFSQVLLLTQISISAPGHTPLRDPRVLKISWPQQRRQHLFSKCTSEAKGNDENKPAVKAEAIWSFI